MEDRGRVLTQFTALKAGLAAALAEKSLPYLIIKHIYTTTVPDLAEEPMDNLLIVITATDFGRDIIKRHHIAILGRCTNSGNYQFQQGRSNQGKRTFRLLDIEPICHVYIVAEDSYFWKRLLAAGDALRSDADLKNEYERCERSFAEGRYPKFFAISWGTPNIP